MLKMRIVAEAGVGHVIFDADGKVVHGAFFLQFIKDALDHGRGEFLGGKAITPADNDRRFLEGRSTGFDSFENGSGDILVERFAICAGFLGAIQDSDGFDGLRAAL